MVSIGIGLFITSLSTTLQQASLGAFVFMPLADVLANPLPMVAIAAVTLTADTWLFKHRME